MAIATIPDITVPSGCNGGTLTIKYRGPYNDGAGNTSRGYYAATLNTATGTWIDPITSSRLSIVVADDAQPAPVELDIAVRLTFSAPTVPEATQNYRRLGQLTDNTGNVTGTQFYYWVEQQPVNLLSSQQLTSDYGAIQELVLEADTLLASIGAPVVQDLPTLKTLNFASVPDKQRFTLLTATPSGYGGGGVFYWDEGATDTPVPGIIEIPTSGGGRLKRLRGTVYSALDFGAVPDGVTDNWAVLNAAVAFLNGLGGGTLFFPEGTYAISQTLELKSNVTLSGANAKNCIIQPTANRSWFLSAPRGGTMLRTDRENGPFNDITIENLTVLAPMDSVLDRNGWAIRLEYVTRGIVRNCIVPSARDSCIRIDGYKKGIPQFSTYDPDWRGYSYQCRIEGCTVGTTVQADSGYLGIEVEGGANVDVVGNTVINSRFHGIRVPNGENMTIDRNRVIACAHSALYLNWAFNVRVTNNDLSSDRTPATAISIEEVKNVLIRGNLIRKGYVTDAVLSTETRYGQGLQIVGNHFVNSADNYILIQFAKQVFIDHNTCQGDDSYVRMNNFATGTIGANNFMRIGFESNQSPYVQGGGNTVLLGSFRPSTGLPDRPDRNATPFIGAAPSVPTVNKGFLKGHILWDNTPAVGDVVGWVNVADGLNFRGFGNVIDTRYQRQLTSYKDGNNQSRTLYRLTVPNTSVAFTVKVVATFVRAPYSDPGAGQLIQRTFHVTRRAGANVVVQTVTMPDDADVALSSAGGANSTSGNSLGIARAGAEAATDPQLVDLTCFLGTGLHSVVAHITMSGVDLTGVTGAFI